jgi:diguanylate cyclase (GGDEF)-like protein
MEETARRDPLTNLCNRRGFEEDFTRILAYASRYDRAGAVLMIDLDGFKEVNDELGHQAGDELLSDIATSLRGRFRDCDLIGRLGGDEFSVVLTDVSKTEALKVAEDVRVLVGGLERTGSESEDRVTTSIGVTLFDGAAGQEELLSRADTAMYGAKQEGGDRVRIGTELAAS